MRVAIDVQATTGKRTGFGYHVLGLLEGFKQLPNSPEFICLKHDKKIAMRTHDRILWDQVQFPMKARAAKPDLLHKPCFSGPIFYHGPQVLTVHDIIPYIFPKNISCTSRVYWNGVLIASIKRAKIIITGSEAAKKDLVTRLGIEPPRINVIYHGIFDSFKQRDEGEARAGLSNLELPEKFFMCVGSLEPRKNLPFLISAYLKVAHKVQEDLVVVGKPGWGLEKLSAVLNGHEQRHRVRFTGYVDDEQLPLLYNLATALLFPSYYEGFGLPPLEAMASGCPVVCSNASSLPEVVGDAAIMLDPNNKDMWARTISRISEAGDERNLMITGGLQRAKKFSWRVCAEKTRGVYEQALALY